MADAIDPEEWAKKASWADRFFQPAPAPAPAPQAPAPTTAQPQSQPSEGDDWAKKAAWADRFFQREGPADPGITAANWDAVQSGQKRFSELPKQAQLDVARQYGSQTAANRIGQSTLANWGDELTAGANALLETSGLGKQYAGKTLGERFADYQAFNQAELEAYAQDHPVADFAANLGGGVVGGLLSPAVRGGGYLAAGLTGAGYGALSGAGEGEGLYERGAGAIGGGVIGAGGGLLGHYVGEKLVGAAAAKPKTPTDLGGTEVPEGVTENLANAYRTAVAQGQRPEADLARAGPNATLGDVPAFASRVRQQIGAGEGDPLVAAARARANDAPTRVRSMLDQTLGTVDPDIEATVAKLKADYTAAAGPAGYDQFRQTAIPYRFSQPLQDIVGDLAQRKPSVINRAMDMAALDKTAGRNMTPNQWFLQQIPGTDRFQVIRDPNANELDWIKRGLDSLARGAPEGEASIYSGISKKLTNEVDSLISPTGNPADSPWARGRAVAAEGFNVQRADEIAKDFWKDSTSRAEAMKALRSVDPGMPQDMVIARVRHAMQEQIDNAAANLRNAGQGVGGTDSIKAVEDFLTPANRDKMHMIAQLIDPMHGPQRAGALLQHFDNELHFANQTSKIMTQADKAATAAAKAGAPQTEPTRKLENLVQEAWPAALGPTGWATTGARFAARGIDAYRAAGMPEAARQAYQAQARILGSRDPAVLATLRQYTQAQAAAAAREAAFRQANAARLAQLPNIGGFLGADVMNQLVPRR